MKKLLKTIQTAVKNLPAKNIPGTILQGRSINFQRTDYHRLMQILAGKE